MKEIIITSANEGGRLDKAVFRYLDNAGRGFVYRMIRKKNITLNDRRCEGSDILRAGDSIKIYLSDETIARFKSGSSFNGKNNTGARSDRTRGGRGNVRTETNALKKIKDAGITIVYEDDNILALYKPAGLLSQKARPDDVSVNDFVLSYVKGDALFRPGIANRLDRNTSGVVLAAKNQAGARELSAAIKERRLSKKYICLVRGKIETAGHFKARLVKNESDNKVTVDPDAEFGSDIETAFRPLAYYAEGSISATLLEVDLITGRSHQIRAHLAYLSHPVAGDAKYGDRQFNRYFDEKYGVRSQLLHAYKVSFGSMNGILEYLNGTVITAEPCGAFADILKEIGYGDLEFQGA